MSNSLLINRLTDYGDFVMFKINPLASFLCASTLILAFTTANADVLSLHQEPKADSPVVGTVDTAKGIMPIYSPKDSDWVKIADPANGNVGWVKQSDLSQANTASVMMKQETISPNGKSSGYTVQVGKPVDSNSPKVQSNLNDIEHMQQNIRRNVQDMVKSMDQLYQKQMQLLKENGYYIPDNTNNAPVSSATPAPGSSSTKSN